MKRKQFDSSFLNSNPPFSEMSFQKFTNACTDFEKVLINILQFLDCHVAPYDFKAASFWSIEDKIELLRKSPQVEKVAPDMRSKLQICLEFYVRVESTRQMVALRLHPFGINDGLEESGVLDAHILNMEVARRKLDEIFAYHHPSYRRITRPIQESLRHCDGDRPFISELKALYRKG